MVTFGGAQAMVLASLAALAVFALLALVLRRPLGWIGALSWSGFLWSLVVIAIFTLLPDRWDPGIISAESRSETCSLDYGGPAPEGFWVFGGGQRLLNTLLFVPAGALMVLAFSRWRLGWLLVPGGVVALGLYAVLIELLQLVFARIDRACDVTDMVDNASGAVIGVGIGLVLMLLLRPWRHRRAKLAHG